MAVAHWDTVNFCRSSTGLLMDRPSMPDQAQLSHKEPTEAAGEISLASLYLLASTTSLCRTCIGGRLIQTCSTSSLYYPVFISHHTAEQKGSP